MADPRSGNGINLVCSSLRDRPQWASVATYLLQTDGRHWREARLNAHDIALSTTNPRDESHTYFRLFLLSPSDVDDPQTWARIDQAGGGLGNIKDTAIVFLLHHPEGIQAAMRPFMGLHVKLATKGYTLPIIPAIPQSGLPAETSETGTPTATTAAAAAAAAAIASAIQTFHASLTDPMLYTISYRTVAWVYLLSKQPEHQ
ncbi:hypothetical protein VTJ04DRAFT_925 [Mycothermus thermophilus]|uniref:uncharacterized protein n=1 Tax=Humicola insolens TaxID=85995 RepID=UPI0037446291